MENLTDILKKEEMEKWAKKKEDKKKENETGALMGFLLKNVQKMEEAKAAAISEEGVD